MGGLRHITASYQEPKRPPPFCVLKRLCNDLLRTAGAERIGNVEGTFRLRVILALRACRGTVVFTHFSIGIE